MTRDLTTIRRDMGDYLPRYYTGEVVTNILDRESEEMADLNADIADVLDQFFIDTATWGLENWERVCGIPTDRTKPNQQRRSVIKSKLRGIGTVTVGMLQSVAQAYDRGTIEVTEQPSLYQFTIKFVDTLGAPPNIDDLKAAMESVKPAHLAVVYAYKYLLISQAQALKISDIQQRKLTDFSPFIPL
jgi:uncharacterized protein YmfQ (DUF2313 family)